jgi:hypothetical protein
MTESEFNALECHARSLSGDYAVGYQRGLQRHYHGESFGTAEQHALWSRTATGDAREFGRGYRDGCEGKIPNPKIGRPAAIEGRGKR